MVHRRHFIIIYCGEAVNGKRTEQSELGEAKCIIFKISKRLPKTIYKQYNCSYTYPKKTYF